MKPAFPELWAAVREDCREPVEMGFVKKFPGWEKECDALLVPDEYLEALKKAIKDADDGYYDGFEGLPDLRVKHNRDAVLQEITRWSRLANYVAN